VTVLPEASEKELTAPAAKSIWRKYLLFLAKLVVGLGLVFYMVEGGYLDFSVFKGAWSNGWHWLILSLAAIIMVPFLGSFRWWLMMRAQNMAVPLRASMRLTFIGAFFNTFMPGAIGGDVVRMYGATVSIPERKAAAILTVIADRVAGFFGLAILAAVVLSINYKAIIRTTLVREAAIIWAGSIAVFAIIVALVMSERLRQRRKKLLEGSGKVREALRHADEALALYRGKWRFLLIAIVLSLFAHTCSIITFLGAARALGETEIPTKHYFFLVPLSLAVNSIPISPGGVGQGESFAEALFKTQMQNASIGAEAFFLYRIVMMLGWLIGLVFYLTGSVKFTEMLEAEKAAEKILAQLPPEAASAPTDSTSHG
jgi:hypothetical protein